MENIKRTIKLNNNVLYYYIKLYLRQKYKALGKFEPIANNEAIREI